MRDNVRGHFFVCFLALYLAAALRLKLAAASLKFPWDEIIRDLSQLRAVTVRLEDQLYVMRSPLKGCTGKVLQALGIKAPPLASPLGHEAEKEKVQW